jgi:hypothetical protein
VKPDQVRLQERRKQPQGDEHRGGRDPPALPQAAGERHHDPDRDADEDEPAPEAQEAAGDHVEVTLLGDVVTALPPQSGDAEREPREPHDREPEHAE